MTSIDMAAYNSKLSFAVHMAFGLLLGLYRLYYTVNELCTNVLCLRMCVLCVYCVRGSWLIVFAALTGEKLSVVSRGLKFMAVAERVGERRPLVLAYLPFHEHNPFQILELHLHSKILTWGVDNTFCQLLIHQYVLWIYKIQTVKQLCGRQLTSPPNIKL